MSQNFPIKVTGVVGAYPPKVPTSRICLAPIEVARSIKNLPCAGVTAMSGNPSALLVFNVVSKASSLSRRNELWYLSDLVQIS